MKTIKKLTMMGIGLALLMAVMTTNAQAERVYVYSPLYWPFAVAGAAVDTAGAIVTGVAPEPRTVYVPERTSVREETVTVYHGPRLAPGAVWVPGHYDQFGDWVPGHWR